MNNVFVVVVVYLPPIDCICLFEICFPGEINENFSQNNNHDNNNNKYIKPLSIKHT